MHERLANEYITWPKFTLALHSKKAVSVDIRALLFNICLTFSEVYKHIKKFRHSWGVHNETHLDFLKTMFEKHTYKHATLTHVLTTHVKKLL